jgi:hypothetical protein
MIFHVYDIRTNETLFYSEDKEKCHLLIKNSDKEKYLRIHWTFKNNIGGIIT